MYVCLCRSVTVADIAGLLAEGASSVREVVERCGASAGCGGCHGGLLRVLALHGMVVDEDDMDSEGVRATVAELGSYSSARRWETCEATTRSSRCSMRCSPPN